MSPALFVDSLLFDSNTVLSLKRLLFLFEHIYDSEQINIENIL